MSFDRDALRAFLDSVDRDELVAAYWRRVNAEHKRLSVGRKAKMAACPKCGRVLNARERRKKCPTH